MKNPNKPFSFLFFPFIVGLLVACLYMVYQNNPHLMATESLYDELRLKRGSDITLVRSERKDEKLGPEAYLPTTMPLKNRQRTSQWKETMRPSHRLEPFTSAKISGFIAGESELQIDGGGVYLSHPKGLAVFDLTGKPTWSFKAPENEDLLPGLPAVAQGVLYTATPKGRIYAFDKSSGRLIWYRASEQTNLRQPILGQSLYVFAQNQKKPTFSDLILLDPVTGEVKKTIGPIDGVPSSEVAFNDDETMAFFTTESANIFSVSLTSGEVLWKAESQAPFKGAPAVLGDRVYAANESGILFAHDGKSGREIWETDLGAKFASPVSILADALMGYLVDRSGYMHAISLRAGKREWRYNTNQTGQPEITTLRMRGSSFAELKVEPKTRYWTLWAFCSSSRLCIFEPNEGLLLHRIELKGKAVSAPFFDGEGEDMHIALTDNWGDSGSEAKALKLVHFMDTKKAKALKEAQKTSPLGAPTGDGL